MNSKGDHTSIKTSYKHIVIKPWSNNKWLLSEVVEERMQGKHRLTMKSEILYKKNGKYGFPSKINVLTTPFIDQGIKNRKTIKRSIKTSLTFSNYEINTGKAKKVVTGNAK